MTTETVNARGYRFPLLLEGCTGCAACSAICPDFVFQVYKYDTPLAAADRVTPRLIEGSEAIADAMIAAGCRFFAGYPMTPFTEVLEHMARKLPGVGGVCMNAESEIEAVGMAWGAAATGTPAATGSTGQGLSLMQESLAEITLARLPLVVLNMARAQGDYFQATRGGGHGDYRHLVLAPADVAEAVELVQWAFHLTARWRNPVLVLGDYYLAHTSQSVEVEPIDFGPRPETDWALDGSTGGSGRAKLVSFLGSVKQRDDVGYDLSDALRGLCQRPRSRCWRRSTPRAECVATEDADVVVVAFGTPAKYAKAAVRALRSDGAGWAWSGPSPCSRSRPTRWRTRPRALEPWRSTRTTRGR